MLGQGQSASLGCKPPQTKLKQGCFVVTVQAGSHQEMAAAGEPRWEDTSNGG